MTSKLIEKRALYLTAICFVVILTYWAKNVVNQTPVVHPEFVMTADFMIKPTQSVDIYKIFDLTITEGSLYRPRIISFLFQYIDSNFIIVAKQYFPKFGIRLIGNYISIGLLIIALLHLMKQLFPLHSFVSRLFVAIIPLTWPAMNGTLLNLAKFDSVVDSIKTGHLSSYIPLSNALAQAIKTNNDYRQTMIKLADGCGSFCQQYYPVFYDDFFGKTNSRLQNKMSPNSLSESNR